MLRKTISRWTLWLISICFGASLALGLSAGSLAQSPQKTLSDTKPLPMPSGELTDVDQNGFKGEPAPGVVTEQEKSVEPDWRFAVSGKHLWATRRIESRKYELFHSMVTDDEIQLDKIAKNDGWPLVITANRSSVYTIGHRLTASGFTWNQKVAPGQSQVSVDIQPKLPLRHWKQVIAMTGAVRGSYVLARQELVDVATTDVATVDVATNDATVAAATDDDGSVDDTNKEGEGDTNGKDRDSVTYQLLQMQAIEWKSIALPEHFNQHRPLAMVTLDQRNDHIAIISADAQKKSIIVDELSQGQWSQQTYEINPQHVHMFSVAQQHLIAIVQVGDNQYVKLLRNAEVLELGPVGLVGPEAHLLTGVNLGEKLGLVTTDADDKLYLQRIDPVASPGTAAPPVELTLTKPSPWAFDSEKLVMLYMVALTVVVLVSNWRRDPNSMVVALPAQMQVADLPKRAFAAMIDMIPAGFLCAIIFIVLGMEEHINQWPGDSTTSEQLLAGQATLGLYILHTMISELIYGTSLGKLILRCQVVNNQGKKPRPGQIVLRNLFKLMELSFPPLLILAVFSSYRQRLGDIFARTVVVLKSSKTDEPSADEK